MKVFNLTPEKISFDKNNLYIQWKDGHCSQWNLLKLRRNCPCASCRGGDFGKVGSMTKNIREASVISYQIIGRYAFQIKWQDAHDTGMYTYSSLKKDCECNLCQKNSF